MARWSLGMIWSALFTTWKSWKSAPWHIYWQSAVNERSAKSHWLFVKSRLPNCARIKRRSSKVKMSQVENKMGERQYAIRDYHDTTKIYSKLYRLISQPMRPVKREKMQEFLGYFDSQCKRSKELTDEAK